MLVLDKKNFYQSFFQEHRNVGLKIYRNALRRRIKYRQTYLEASRFCKKEKKKERKLDFHNNDKTFYRQFSNNYSVDSSSTLMFDASSDLDNFEFLRNENTTDSNSETEVASALSKSNSLNSNKSKIKNSPQTDKSENNQVLFHYLIILFYFEIFFS